MKHRLRVAVVHLLYGIGVLQLLARIVLRRRAVVLMYHRVLSADGRARTWSHPGIVVSLETFEMQMRVLQRYFRVLSFESFRASLERGRFESRSCLVTFDDGWMDTYTEAWPVLKRHAVPALVFLPSAYIGTGEMFWQEGLSRILHAIWQRARRDRAFADRARPAVAAFNLEAVLEFPEANLRRAIHGIVQGRKADNGLDPAAPMRALRPLVPDAFDASANVDRFIGWEEAREMARDGMVFGAHGETHRRLTTLPAGDVRREVERSREALERGLGAPTSAFCYPNGDWNAGVAGAVAEGRFDLAFSTERGRVDSTANRLAIRRVNVHEDMTNTAPMFLARLVGVV